MGVKMTRIYVQRIGDKALVSQEELEQIIEIARRYEEVSVQVSEDDIPTIGMMRLVEQGGAFDFWLDPDEDIYSAEDGEPVR